MSVSVRIPTILRTYTGGESEVTADGGTLAEVLETWTPNYPGIKGRILDDAGRAAPVRQRVRRQRRRALPRRPGDADPRRRADLGHPGGRRRLGLSPEAGQDQPNGGPVSREGPIGGQQLRALLFGLDDEQAVEGVAVDPRQGLDGRCVLGDHGESVAPSSLRALRKNCRTGIRGRAFPAPA